MLRDPMDRLQMVFIVVVAIAAVAIAVIGSSIVDRSYEHVKAIKQTKIEGTPDDISMDIVQNSDNANTLMARSGAPNELRFSDQTVTLNELKTFIKEPKLTRMKMLRCDFKSEDFDVLKDSKIKFISMSDVPVDKALIDAFSAMPQLTTLEMFRCVLEKNALMNLPVSKVQLVKFRKSGETSRRIFTRALAKDLARMPNLVYAELGKTSFEEGAIAGFAGAQFVVLDLARSNASDADLEAIKNSPHLQFLDVEDCTRISCKGLKSIAQSHSLKQVRTNIPTSSCNFTPAIASKFQPDLYRIPEGIHFEKD